MATATICDQCGERADVETAVRIEPTHPGLRRGVDVCSIDCLSNVALNPSRTTHAVHDILSGRRPMYPNVGPFAGVES